MAELDEPDRHDPHQPGEALGIRRRRARDQQHDARGHGQGRGDQRSDLEGRRLQIAWDAHIGP